MAKVFANEKGHYFQFCAFTCYVTQKRLTNKANKNKKILMVKIKKKEKNQQIINSEGETRRRVRS